MSAGDPIAKSRIAGASSELSWPSLRPSPVKPVPWAATSAKSKPRSVKNFHAPGGNKSKLAADIRCCRTRGFCDDYNFPFAFVEQLTVVPHRAGSRLHRALATAQRWFF
jgi:hypothetical protein